MTNHWRDIQHADVSMINSANPAEAHPGGYHWCLKAKLDPRRGIGRGGGAKMIHIDPRFTRTSAVSDVYARIRTGTDTAFFGGLINYVLEKNLIHHEYVKHYTNASFIVKQGLGFSEGLFNGYDPGKRTYDTATWVYAVGLTQHTTGGQLIRTAAVLQLLLGNMGRPGGGMNAERGHANIQGNTDNAISWEILPGYLRIPAPGQKNLDDYVTQSAPKKFDANSWNFFGTNYRKFMVSLLKTWYGDAATDKNEYAFDFVPKPATNSSWISIYDQALKKKMEGVILSGMTATSIGPDANQLMTALGNLK